MKKHRKKAGGMTLVEIIVALAVFTIISALLASACASICYMMRKTERLNKHITNEAPAAEIRDKSGCTVPTDAGGADSESSMVFTVDGKDYKILGKEYISVDGENNYEEGGNFRFFEGDSVVE